MDFTYVGHFAKSIPTSHETSWGAHLVGPLKTACKRVAGLWQSAPTLPKIFLNETVQEKTGGIAAAAWRKVCTPGAWLGDAAIGFEAERQEDAEHKVIRDTQNGATLTDEMLKGTENATSVLVPLTIKGELFDSNHIVWVGYKNNGEDRKELFYYDPKGKGISDQRVRDAVTVLARKYNLDASTLVINKVRHQRDSHNCGVWGIQLMRDIRTKSFAEIATPSSVDIEQARLELAQEIVNYCQKLS